MCQQIIQFCSGSTKPLVFAGSLLTLLLATGLGYLACSANSFYQDIDPALAQSRSLSYHLQLLASAYLILISMFACFAAHYDQKHSIRALAALTSLNFLLAVAAILMLPSRSPTELENQFKTRLMDAKAMYNYTLKPEVAPTLLLQNLIEASQSGGSSSGNQTTSGGATTDLGKARPARMAALGETTTPAPQQPLNGTTATNLWDNLQARGCCGFNNHTDWGDKLPKSCCSKPEEDKNSKEFVCKSTDEQHNSPCIEIIGTIGLDFKNLGLMLVLALIALVNLYLANVTGISAYRTLHYNEASQNAYS